MGAIDTPPEIVLNFSGWPGEAVEWWSSRQPGTQAGEEQEQDASVLVPWRVLQRADLEGSVPAWERADLHLLVGRRTEGRTVVWHRVDPKQVPEE